MTDETLQAAEEAELPVEGSEISTEENEDEALESQEERPAEPQDDPQEEQEDPDWYVKAINRQHRKFREEERKRIELEQRLQQIEQGQPRQQDARPDIPPPPDPFDEDYEQKIQQRDDAIRKAIEWDANQQARQAYEYQRQQQAMQERAQALRSTLTTYTQRANELGIKADELQVAGNTVSTMGIHDDVASYILADEKGPLITTYLARHPREIEAMHQMSPVQAAVHIATKVRQKAEQQHGKTQAPPPPESLDGGGTPPRQRGPKGATFE